MHRFSFFHANRSRVALTSLAAALVAAALAGSLQAEEPAASPGLPPADPAAVGMDAARLQAIPARLGESIAAHQISGGVALVARDGKLVQLASAGDADLASKRPMAKDSLFAVASMTKPITATALLMLQDEGKLSIDDPVSKTIPEFKDVKLNGASPAHEITIRHLLTHTSGLGTPQQAARPGESLREFVLRIAAEPMLFEPGSQWKYGNGLTVCGRIIEVVSGQSYPDFLEQRLLAPLKMVDTTFYPTARQRERLATLYKVNKESHMLEPTPHAALADSGGLVRMPNPSGGLFSTAADMARFYQMILNGGELDGRRYVSAAAVEQMTHVQTGNLVTGFTPGNGWGLGWCVVREPQGVTKMLSPGTYGHGGAFGTQGWVDPQRKLIVVLMVQWSNFGNSDGSDLRAAVQQLAVDAIRD